MNALRYVNINGKLTDNATIPADNSAFRYGVGIFETMLTINVAIRLWQYHWERLSSGLPVIGLIAPTLFTADYMQEQILRTVHKNKPGALCRVRLQLFGGSGGIFGPDDNKPHFIIECYSLTPDILELNTNGLVIGIADELRKSADALANLKSANALIYAAAARQAKTNKWNDALICNTNGNVIESAIANIFWIKDGAIHTPPLSDGCVAGVMRRHLLTALPDITQQPLTADELLTADEVFLTNAIKGIRWVGTIDSAAYHNNRTRQLYAAIRNSLELQ